jgi:uncharacterized membrane protein YfcA
LIAIFDTGNVAVVPLASVAPFTLSAIGGAVGLLGGLFGKGGSAVATPLLHLAGVPALMAIATPLPATIPATAAAAGTYWRQGLVNRRVLGWTVAFGVPATVIGALATRWIGGAPLIIVTDVVVAVLGLRFLLWPMATDRPVAPPPGRLALALVATAVGLISGLLANSGGFLLAPLFVALLRLPIKSALATSLAASCVLAVPGTIVHLALGHIDWRVAAWFGLASIPLSALGARIALRTEPARLERGYGAVLATVGLALLATA